MTEGAGPYRVMAHRPVLGDGPVVVRAVEPEHIEAIRCWRNAQIDVLRQSRPITADEQVAYFERAVWPDKRSDRPANILLGLFENNAPQSDWTLEIPRSANNLDYASIADIKFVLYVDADVDDSLAAHVKAFYPAANNSN